LGEDISISRPFETQHWIERRLHRVADKSGFVFDDQLWCRVATQRVGVAGQRDDARPICQTAAAFIVLFEDLGRLEILEEPGNFCEQLFGLSQARADKQDQARIVDRRVERDGSCRRRLAGLPAAIEKDPRRARAEKGRLPGVGLEFEPILHERDRIERMGEIKREVKRHAPPRREVHRSLSLSTRGSP
jgi:hypothetical protein